MNQVFLSFGPIHRHCSKMKSKGLDVQNVSFMFSFILSSKLITAVIVIAVISVIAVIVPCIFCGMLEAIQIPFAVYFNK